MAVLEQAKVRRLVQEWRAASARLLALVTLPTLAMQARGPLPVQALALEREREPARLGRRR